MNVCFKLVIVSLSLLNVQVTGNCNTSTASHNPGTFWRHPDNCLVHRCNEDSTVTSFRKDCPKIQCSSMKLQVRDCCPYCDDNGNHDIPDNGDRSNGYKTHACKRECKSGETMVCKYTFEISQFEAASTACGDCPFNLTDCDRKNCIIADGVPRLIIPVERSMPGPTIHVCKGDTIVVDVENHLTTETFTMHWHGIIHTFTQYMDGVPHATQCPISPGNIFRYTFPAYEEGTFFYHPHVGTQVMEGCLGGLIIRLPDSENPHRKLYDFDLYEHFIALQDWSHLYGEDHYARAIFGSAVPLPDSILINGRGPIFSQIQLLDVRGNVNVTKVMQIPFAEFTVEKGYKYRFRILNGASYSCPLSLSIDNHTMTIISTDGADVEPVEVDQMVTNDAERYDIILNANQDVANYWIRVKGIDNCEPMMLQQLAILRYKGSSPGNPKQPKDYEYPQINGTRFGNVMDSEGTIIKVSDLRSLLPLEEGIGTDNPDYKYYVDISMRTLFNPTLSPYPDNRPVINAQLNNITARLLPGSLLTEPNLPEDNALMCNETTHGNKNCSTELCRCVHIINVRRNAILEVIMYNTGFDTVRFEHPMHYHGYTFRVVAMEKTSRITKEQVSLVH
ncbi:unnamed protein product [Hermetia illucens]|uniref:Uncharacterized protein n=1 Tax=Hermetia illucens TaxID=343691 RepID=A0A7R8V1D6_HERIL|nr:unnamed protein product [Hermetia illucens]